MSSDEEVDFYKILGLEKDASDADVKKAFRKFSLKYHPDMQHGKSEAEKKEAEETFKRGQAAYECLSDPEKRKVYDQFGIDGLKGHAQQGGFSGMPSGLAEFIRRHMGGFGFGFDGNSDESDSFGFNFNPFSHAHGAEAKSRVPTSEEPEDGKSYRIRMAVDLEDVIFGTEKEFTINGMGVCPECHAKYGKKCESYEECPQCGGLGMTRTMSGNVIYQSTCAKCGGAGYFAKNPCKKCNGTGRVEVKRELKVKIPKGMPDGGQLRVRGAGDAGLNGGSDGDLFIVVQVKPNEVFSRLDDGLTLAVDAYANPLISVFGGSVSIPTPYEMKVHQIVPGVKNGQKIRIPGYGIRLDNGQSGDLIVNLRYDSIDPNELSSSDKEILKRAFDVVSKKPNCMANAVKQHESLSKLNLPFILEL